MTEQTNREPDPKRHRPHLSANLAMILALFVGINIASNIFKVRLDLTGENLYTLSDGTRKIVSGLEEELTVKYYFSKGLANLPRQYMGIKTYGQKILELLQEYESFSGNFKLEIIDPEPDTETEEDAQKYALQGVPLPTKEKFYMGLVVLYAGNEKAIPFFDPTRVEYLEYDITRTIDEVTKGQKPKVGVLSPLPLREVFGMPFAQPGMPAPQPGWLFMKELEKTSDVEMIETGADKLPEKLSMLLVVHPKSLSEKLLYAIDQYVMSGGHLVVLTDPYCRSDESVAPGGQPFGQTGQKSSDLNRLLNAWGAETTPTQIAASQRHASVVAAGGEGRVNMPTWIGLTETAGLNKDYVVTNQLDTVRFIEPGWVKKKEVEGVEFIPLITADGETGELGTMEVQFGYIENLQRLSWKSADMHLAALLKGKFKSAFTKTPEGVEAKDHKGACEADNTVLVVGDVDFIADDYWVNRLNFFGQVLLRPVNDNFNFLANAIEFLSGSDALISIRSRGKFERPFSRVQELQTRAEARWRQEELALVKKLQEAEEELNKLTGAKVEDGRIILTPEQEEKIKEFREKQVQTRRELRTVRRELREDVEWLGTKITAYNLAVIPMIVAVFGFWFIRNRR